MKVFDRVLLRWRIWKVLPGDRLLDIGCGGGALLEGLAEHLREGIGIDTAAPETSR